MNQVKVAVVGVGAFGRQHARVLAALPEADLVAVADSNGERAREVASEFACQALTDPAAVAGNVQAVCLAVPTTLHADVGVKLLEQGIDLLVEKPVAADLAQADRLIEAAARHGRILQVGHLERFNPVVEAALSCAELPLFFEVHRLGSFSARSLDVDVVLDLMIHDLDIILAMVHSPIARLEASGVAVLSPRPDIASVRLIFENGCVANLTASRISLEKIRKLRYFQPGQYVSIDYGRQEGIAHRVDQNQQLAFDPIACEKAEPLERQLRAFLQSVETRKQAGVNGVEARAALDLALRIRGEIESHSQRIAATLAAHKP